MDPRTRQDEVLPQLPPMTMLKESILDEFLKSLPPLPQSPVDLRWPSHQTNLRSGPVAIPNERRFTRPTPSISSSNRGIERSRPSPLPAPIITSQERCQQILQSLSDRVEQFHSSLTETTPVPVSRPVVESNVRHGERSAGTPRPPFSMQRPLIMIPSLLETHAFAAAQTTTTFESDSGASTPSSAYNSAREDFTFGSISDLVDLELEQGVREEEGVRRNPDRNMAGHVQTRRRNTNPPSSSTSTHGDSSAVSSPWTALSPASSIASDSSAGSSWTVGSM